jgi:ATP-dependent Zn protease
MTPWDVIIYDLIVKRVKPKKKPQNLNATSTHEAAHFVVTHMLCPTNYQDVISIIPFDGTLGRVIGEDLHGTDPGKLSMDDIENAVITLYSGYMGEILICKTPSRIAKLGAADDFELADEYLELTDLTGAKLKRLRVKLINRTRAVIKKYRPAIEAVAKEVKRIKVLPCEEAALIADAAMGDTTAGQSLETLRQLKTLT